MNIDSVSRLLRKNDLASKLELLDIFKSSIESNVNEELKCALMDYLIADDSRQRVSSFNTVRCYGPGSGLSRYVANQLLLSANVRSIKNRNLVLEQLQNALTNLYDSKNPLLNVTRARLLIELVENFLGTHFHKLTQKRFLSLYFVPYESKINNAAFDNNTNSIAVFRTKDRKQQSPEYIFLHEFGHVVHSRLFYVTDHIPLSFLDFNRELDKRFLQYSKEDQLEIYADFFSIAIMLDSEYEYLNPFVKVMRKEHTTMIKEYFLQEIGSLSVQ